MNSRCDSRATTKAHRNAHRRVDEDAICVALDGTVSGRSCEFPAKSPHSAERVYLVTESLGSRMAFDALVALERDARKQGPAALSAFDEAVAPIVQIFMLANQLPLLALAKSAAASDEARLGVESAPMPSLVGKLSAISEGRRRLRSQGVRATSDALISVVAFTDANDLLS